MLYPYPGTRIEARADAFPSGLSDSLQSGITNVQASCDSLSGPLLRKSGLVRNWLKKQHPASQFANMSSADSEAVATYDAFVVFAIDLTHCSSPFELSHHPFKSIGVELEELSRRKLRWPKKTPLGPLEGGQWIVPAL
jgi:hypothetical protein